MVQNYYRYDLSDISMTFLSAMQCRLPSPCSHLVCKELSSVILSCHVWGQVNWEKICICFLLRISCIFWVYPTHQFQNVVSRQGAAIGQKYCIYMCWVATFQWVVWFYK